MRPTLSLTAVGHATSLFFVITFLLCIAVSLAFPAHTMATPLQRLLPGFEWISWASVFLGLIETYGYGWYVALIWVPLYNVFAARGQQ
jgi:hypothetical protein